MVGAFCDSPFPSRGVEGWTAGSLELVRAQSVHFPQQMALHQEIKIIVGSLGGLGIGVAHVINTTAQRELGEALLPTIWGTAPVLFSAVLGYITDCPWLKLRKRLTRLQIWLLLVGVYVTPFVTSIIAQLALGMTSIPMLVILAFNAIFAVVLFWGSHLFEQNLLNAPRSQEGKGSSRESY